MACPFFMPVEKLENGTWPHPARLPLGCGWSGHCTAPGHEGEVPERDVLEQSCNLGYATTCGRLPTERAWDAVRFAVAAPDQRQGNDRVKTIATPSRIVYLRYVCERDHRPAENGRLSFDAGNGSCLQGHFDIRVQRMAECFLESCLAKST